jgi:mannosyltransferase OCH1-like enzyme
MIPKVIHQTAKILTPEEKRIQRRLTNNLVGWEYRFWSDADNEQLVSAKFPKYRSIFNSIRRGVVKADIARYAYLAVFGGFYFDTDYKLTRGIDDTILDHRCILPVSRNTHNLFRLGNAVMGSEPEHPFWLDFLHYIFQTTGLSETPEHMIEKVTGPEGLTDFFLARREKYRDIYLPSTQMFHPPITRFGLGFKATPETLGAHLCWGSWRSMGVLGKTHMIFIRKITSLF